MMSSVAVVKRVLVALGRGTIVEFFALLFLYHQVLPPLPRRLGHAPPRMLSLVVVGSWRHNQRS